MKGTPQTRNVSQTPINMIKQQIKQEPKVSNIFFFLISFYFALHFCTSKYQSRRGNGAPWNNVSHILDIGDVTKWSSLLGQARCNHRGLSGILQCRRRGLSLRQRRRCWWRKRRTAILGRHFESNPVHSLTPRTSLSSLTLTHSL